MTDFSQTNNQDFYQPVPATAPQKSNKLPWLLTGILVLLLPLVGVGGFYLGSQKLSSSSDLVMEEEAPSPSTTSDAQEETTAPSKRLFDPSKKWYLNEPFPSELTAVPEGELVGLTCTSKYAEGGIGGGGLYFTYSDGKSKATQLDDQKLMALVNSVGEQTGKRVTEFFACQSNQLEEIFVFEEHAGGGGSNNTVYFGMTSDKDNFQKAMIPNPGVAYFNCQKALQYTTFGELFVECGGGDGGGGASSIYKIDLVNEKTTLIRSCSSTPDEVVCK